MAPRPRLASRDPVPPPGPGTATELVVTVRISTDDRNVAQVAARFAEMLRAAFDPATVLDPIGPERRELRVVPASPALHIHVPSRTVRLYGEKLELTRLEFDLLLQLGRCAGRVFTRQDLLRTVWRTADPAHTRTVDVHIRRLRAKLGADLPLIATIRRVGYRLDAGGDLAVEE